jgi:NADPH2:quinone reductase
VGAVLGARVVAAASTPEKTSLGLERGAEAAIDYTTEDLKVRIKEITGGGAHVVIDPVGGPNAELALRALRWGGRFVSVGFASGEIPRIPLNLVLLKGVVVTGFTMEGFARHQAPDRKRDQAELAALAREGRAAPYISATYPLERVGQALSDLAERRATGKVLVDPTR